MATTTTTTWMTLQSSGCRSFFDVDQSRNCRRWWRRWRRNSNDEIAIQDDEEFKYSTRTFSTFVRSLSIDDDGGATEDSKLWFFSNTRDEGVELHYRLLLLLFALGGIILVLSLSTIAWLVSSIFYYHTFRWIRILVQSSVGGISCFQVITITISFRYTFFEATKCTKSARQSSN